MKNIYKLLLFSFLFLSSMSSAVFAFADHCEGSNNTIGCYASAIITELPEFFLNADDNVKLGLSFTIILIFLHVVFLDLFRNRISLFGDGRTTTWIAFLSALMADISIHMFLNYEPALPIFGGYIAFALLLGGILYLFKFMYDTIPNMKIGTAAKTILGAFLIFAILALFISMGHTIAEGIEKTAEESGESGVESTATYIVDTILDIAEFLYNIAFWIFIGALIILGVPLLFLIVAGGYGLSKLYGRSRDKNPAVAVRQDMEEIDGLLTRIQQRRPALRRFLNNKQDEISRGGGSGVSDFVTEDRR